MKQLSVLLLFIGVIANIFYPSSLAGASFPPYENEAQKTLEGVCDAGSSRISVYNTDEYGVIVLTLRSGIVLYEAKTGQVMTYWIKTETENEPKEVNHRQFDAVFEARAPNFYAFTHTDAPNDCILYPVHNAKY